MLVCGRVLEYHLMADGTQWFCPIGPKVDYCGRLLVADCSSSKSEQFASMFMGKSQPTPPDRAKDFLEHYDLSAGGQNGNRQHDWEKEFLENRNKLGIHQDQQHESPSLKNVYREVAAHFESALQTQHSPDKSHIWSQLRPTLIRFDNSHLQLGHELRVWLQFCIFSSSKAD
jgi:hypothetical protein